MVADPHRKCTCGHRRFRTGRTPVEQDVQRWMYYDPQSAGIPGFGATPFGTYFGSGFFGEWGLFDAVYRAVSEAVTCERCQRVRSNMVLGGITVLGSYVSGGWFYVAAADVARPATCYELRLVGPSGVTYQVPLSYHPGPPPPIAATPPATTQFGPPPASESSVDTLLRTRLPEVSETGSYTAYLFDRCSEQLTPLSIFELEAPPMIIVPQQADLGGFPHLWLRQQFESVAQLASRSRLGIPLEYCEAVIEYDARLGTLPSSQGWTHQTAAGGAASDFQLVEGGALRVNAYGGGDDTYWEADETLAAGPSSVHAYAHWLVDSMTLTPAAGEGLSFQGLFASSGGAYSGVRWEGRDTELRVTEIDGASDAAWTEGEHSARGWHSAGFERGAGNGQGVYNELYDEGLAFGSLAGPAGADEIRARFGNIAGEIFTAYVRNFVVSTPGRFCRPWFTAYTQVTDPTLRLYLVSDLPATSDRSARFLVRYGAGTGAPYATPTSTASVTTSFATSNVVYEVGVPLTGLIANNPFWFTVERDWSHADDTIQATTWLYQATVRAL